MDIVEVANVNNRKKSNPSFIYKNAVTTMLRFKTMCNNMEFSFNKSLAV